MPKSKRKNPDRRKSEGSPAEADQEAPAELVQQAIALRDVLRDAAAKAAELVKAIQQDRKQARQLKTALASLRELKSLEV